jgi:hypothetical protein
LAAEPEDGASIALDLPGIGVAVVVLLHGPSFLCVVRFARYADKLWSCLPCPSNINLAAL